MLIFLIVSLKIPPPSNSIPKNTVNIQSFINNTIKNKNNQVLYKGYKILIIEINIKVVKNRKINVTN